jgi:peptidoglycan hydrolase-like protein with peptidoglycan-binding domain
LGSNRKKEGAMKLQGRDLKPNQRGDDVAALQAELGELELRTELADPPGFFGATTLAAVRELQARARLPVTGVVDAETARRMDALRSEAGVERFVVRGQVRDPDGTPLPELAVELVAQGLRRTRPLGEGRTDRAGEYSIAYEPPERPFGVVVRARRPDEEEAAVTSDRICAPRPVEVVDLTVGGAYRGPSELAALRARLEPILAAERAEL